MASAPSVSTPQTRTCGASARKAVATPAMSPPPPMLTRTSVTVGASVANSRPAVPWAAITSGSSNGCTSVAPAATSSWSSANAPSMVAVRRTSAPLALASSTDRAGADSGITTVAATPSAPAASATAMPWLPPLTATTPAARSASDSDVSFAKAPRALNDPVRCSSSSLSVTGTAKCAARPGLGRVGVRSTYGATRSAAARTSAMSIRFPTDPR